MQKLVREKKKGCFFCKQNWSEKCLLVFLQHPYYWFITDLFNWWWFLRVGGVKGSFIERERERERAAKKFVVDEN